MSKQSSRGKRWQALRKAVLDRDGWTCTACGAWLAEDHPDPHHDATVDHVIAKAAGGRDELSNLVAMCRFDNGRKSDKTLIRTDYWSPRWLPQGLPS